MAKTHTAPKLIMLSILTFSLAIIANSQIKPVRNLKDYEIGPTFKDYDSRWGGNEPEITRERDTYLWEVWSKKKRGYFTRITYNRHGQGIPCTFYVEKGSNDTWQITQECDTLSICPYILKEKCQESRFTKVVYNQIDKIKTKDGKFTLYWHQKKIT